jgi:hypothetical protein
MTKDRKARNMGYLTISAIGVVMASIVDSMRAAQMPNEAVHHFLDQLEDGFSSVLYGEPQTLMLGLVFVLRRDVASND